MPLPLLLDLLSQRRCGIRSQKCFAFMHEDSGTPCEAVAFRKGLRGAAPRSRSIIVTVVFGFHWGTEQGFDHLLPTVCLSGVRFALGPRNESQDFRQ